jgi:hypothetical protein
MRRFWLFAIVILALGTAACQQPDVYNVEQASFSAPASASLDDVQRAILSAGTDKGWVMQVVAPGPIVATRKERSHRAAVDIVFTARTYSNTCKVSTDLDDDGHTIHGADNEWVRSLRREIVRSVEAI